MTNSKGLLSMFLKLTAELLNLLRTWGGVNRKGGQIFLRGGNFFWKKLGGGQNNFLRGGKSR